MFSSETPQTKPVLCKNYTLDRFANGYRPPVHFRHIWHVPAPLVLTGTMCDAPDPATTVQQSLFTIPTKWVHFHLWISLLQMQFCRALLRQQVLTLVCVSPFSPVWHYTQAVTCLELGMQDTHSVSWRYSRPILGNTKGETISSQIHQGKNISSAGEGTNPQSK